MEFKNILEENNLCQATGIVCSELQKTHQVEGEHFVEFFIEVERLSRIVDKIPVTISERCLAGKEIEKGSVVKVEGEYRSYNKLQNEKSKLILHLFAKEIEILPNLEDKKQFENQVVLTGFVCKEPIYRKTPFDREICDVLLAVNRTNYHKSDYVPCILWGRNARFMANQTVGAKVQIVGRIQSRDYVKTFASGLVEERTAYEVSCQKITLLSNITLIKEDSKTEVERLDIANQEII